MKGCSLTAVYRFSIDHPKTVLALAAVCVVAVAPGLLRLQLRTDGNALLPSDTPQIRFDRSIRQAFGITDQMVVLIEAERPEGIFNADTLNLVRELTRQIGELEGLDPTNLTSLATEKSDRVIPGRLRFREFLNPLPQTPEELQQLRDDLEGIGLYTGTLISYDESATCILVGVPQGIDRTRLYREIEHLIAPYRVGHSETLKISVVGAPVAESLMGTHILADLGVPEAWLGGGLPEDHRAKPVQFPRSFYELRRWIAHWIGLVPVALAVMFLTFLVTFRSLTAALLPLSEVGACLIFVFGLMGWCDVPIYLTIAALPIILTAMGIADEIHIFSHYRHLLGARPDVAHAALVSCAMSEMWRPVVKTSLTTAIGFLSFCLSPLNPVRAFGMFTAVGILFCMVWSLTVIPACLTLAPAGWFFRRPPGDSQTSWTHAQSRFGALASNVIRHRGVTILLAVVIIAATPFGVRRLYVQDSWIDGFARESEFYQATQAVNRGFRGGHILVVVAETPHHAITGEVEAAAVGIREVHLPPEVMVEPHELVNQWIELRPLAPASRGPGVHRDAREVLPRLIESARVQDDHLVIKIYEYFGTLKSRFTAASPGKYSYEISPRRMLLPQTLELLCGLEDFIERHTEYAVGGVLGPCEYISTLNYTSRARNKQYHVVPDRANRVHWLWRQYGKVRGQHRLREVLDPEHARSLTTVFLTNANYRDTARLMEAIRGYEDQYLAPQGISLGFAGDVAISQTLIQAIVRTQLTSLLLSLAGILAVAALLARSARRGLLCVLPCSLAVLINFAIMGWLGIPIGVATSMFAAMTLGIGVDFAIHLIERRELLIAAGTPEPQATIGAAATTGPAILVHTVAIALGFGVLIFSQVPSNARLGGLIVLSVLNCLLWTFLLPCLLCRRPQHPSNDP